MRAIQLVLITCIVSLAVFACDKDEAKDNKLYKGTVLAKACPSIAVIDVTNAEIGGEWTANEKHDHVIAIYNCPDEIEIGASVSFYLDLSSNYLDCQAVRPCTQELAIMVPSDRYCSRELVRSN